MLYFLIILDSSKSYSGAKKRFYAYLLKKFPALVDQHIPDPCKAIRVLPDDPNKVTAIAVQCYLGHLCSVWLSLCVTMLWIVFYLGIDTQT